MYRYKIQGVVDFGKGLLESGDLDPIYTMLVKSKLPERTLHYWLVAYWMFYHSGVCSWIAEADDDGQFWDRVWKAGKNVGNKFPRGTDRRHFRAKNALSSIEQLQFRFPDPSNFIGWLSKFAPSWKRVTNAAKAQRGYGPWIAFKICDMVDRVLGVPLNFHEDDIFMFDSPREGAQLVWDRKQIKQLAGDKYNFDGALHIPTVVALLKQYFSAFKAPPLGDRPVDLPEIETVLCKYKSHVNGRYWVGHDIIEIKAHCEGWGDLAEQLRENCP